MPIPIPVPKFDGCDECIRLHADLEAEFERTHVRGALDPNDLPNVQLVMDLVKHISTDHETDMELARIEHDAHIEKVNDHGANPLVKAFSEMGDNREPAFEGDTIKCGLDTVRPDRPTAWAEGYLNHLHNDVYPMSIASAGYALTGVVMHALLEAAFYGGVYAERNRLLSEPIAL